MVSPSTEETKIELDSTQCAIMTFQNEKRISDLKNYFDKIASARFLISSANSGGFKIVTSPP